MALIGVFFISMTRLERKEAELQKLYEYRATAMRNNDIMWLNMNHRKIDALEKEIIEMRKYEPMKLSEVLKDQPESMKNDIYKALLRISVLADVVNEACMMCKGKMKQLGLDDFSLRAEVADMDRLSQKIASFVLAPRQQILEDFIVDNAAMVNGCIILADKYINDKLKL